MGFYYFKRISIFSGLVLSFTQTAQADDAQVLPQGRFRLRLATTYTQVGNEYTSEGEIRSLGASYSKNITGKILAGLTPNASKFVQALNGMQAGLGDSIAVASLNADVKSSFLTNTLATEYGVTDRLSVGVILPIVHADIEVNASSEPSPEFNALMNKFKGSPQMQAQFNQILSGTSVQGLNALLHDQFRYTTALNSWSGDGIGDLEIGGKYNWYRAQPLMATVKAGLRLPTGRKDDPDNLVDVGFGDGQYDLGAYHYVDYQVSPSLSFTHEVGYTAQLSNSGSYRVPLSSELPLGAPAVELDRTLGDYWETGIETNYTVFKLLTFTGKYRFKQKFEDSYSGGPAGADLRLLEAHTDELLHEGQFQIEYSNLSKVRAGVERLPFGVALLYRQPFGGKNIADSRTAGVQLKTYF